MVWYVRDNSHWLERDDRSCHYYKADEVTAEEYGYLMYKKRIIRKEGDYCFPGTTRFDHTIYVATSKVLAESEAAK